MKKEQEEKSSLRSRIAESTSTSQKDKAALDGLRKKVAFLESDNASVVQQLKKLGEIDQSEWAMGAPDHLPDLNL